MSSYIWLCIWTGKMSPIARLPVVQFLLSPPPPTSEKLPTPLAGTGRKAAVLGKLEQDNTLPTYDQGNFNQLTTRSWNRNTTLLVKFISEVAHH